MGVSLRLGLALLCALGSVARAEAPATQPASTPEAENTESDLYPTEPREIIKDWNQYDLRLLTFKWGLYTIIDFGNAAQSDASREQIHVEKDFKIRDFRFTFSGKLATERPITYTMGLMYDGVTNTWFPRETGIQMGIPELWGNVFIGRQKEGISLNKITVGYAVWTMERMPMNDASIPIMADGIKWLGGLPNKRANWNLAYFHNRLPKSPSTDWYDDVVVGRLAVLPMLPDKEGALLHLGAAYHWGQFSDNRAQLRSKPESSTAPYFVDTGEFPANENHLVGLEAYFRKRNWLAGSEFLLDFIRAPDVGNPFLWGGEAFVSWIVTGEERPYIDLGGKLGFVKVARSAFDGGPGTLEAVLHASYTDLDDGDVQGGRFWRLTPQLNWYLDDMVSLRVNYGLGRLDRFGEKELTNFFQFRVQFQVE